MVPDKIYTTPVGTYDTKHIPDLQDKIYIRKDFLLEWAKEKNARLDGTGGDYTEGYLHAMIDLIDKLESI